MRRLWRALTARAAARLSPDTERRLLVLRSHLASRPTIGMPDADRVLVLAPHPDDETLAGGGTAALLARAGADVTVCVVTDGSDSRVALGREELVRRRAAEAKRACRLLGLPEPRLAGLSDGRLANDPEPLGDLVQDLLDEVRPECVLLPWFGDHHHDHAAVAKALAATESPQGLTVWGAEVWTPAPVTRLVDITAVADAKDAALAAHTTAAEAFDITALASLDRFRSSHGLRGRGRAEGFLVQPFPDYRSAVLTWEAGSEAGSDAPHTGNPT